MLKALVQKDYGNGVDNDSYQDYANRKRLMKFNRFFSQYKVFTIVYAVATAFAIILLLYLFNRLEAMSLNGLFTGGEISYSQITIWHTIQSTYPVMLLILAVSLTLYFKFAYNIRVSFGNINVGQKGTARWTTREELEQQYKKVPEREVPFAGMGGIPIARDGNELYIDDTATNNLILGGTRSGKGQIVIEPMAEIYSRAKEKASMILTDPKLELASHMLPELERRGYQCYILNLIDPEFSMGYNPLKLIIDAYKRGDEDTAQRHCASLGYTVFPNNIEEKDPYWTNQARNVFIAAIWAEVEDNISADCLENQRRMYAHDKKEAQREAQYLKKLYGSAYKDYQLRCRMERILETEPNLSNLGILAELMQADKAGAKHLLMEGITEEKIERLRHFQCQPSQFKKKPFYPTTEHEEKISIYSLIKLCNSLSAMKLPGDRTALDQYFSQRPEDNFARITYGSILPTPDNTKGTIMSTFQVGVKAFTYDSIARMTAESSLDFSEIAFGKKPVAIFIGLPDYDKSNYFFATVFINQMYFVLAKLATAMPGGELYRRVAFILDEFGNLPALDNIGNIVTVCLGRNMVFSFFVQSISQLEKLYKEDAKTIQNNCGNQVYIMTGDLDTCKEISEKLGNETITVINRTGKKLSPSKEMTEMSEESPLLRPDELMCLEMGETIIFRFMFRETRVGTKMRIKATPIANMGEYHMKYAYEYISDLFPKEQRLYQSPDMERIYEINPELQRNTQSIVPADLRRTDHINLKARSRNAGQYVAEQKWREQAFCVIEKPTQDDWIRINQAFDLMNLTKEERERYLAAGQIVHNEETGEDEIQYPNDILRNGAIIDYGTLLLTVKNPVVVENGFALLDLMKPLPKGKKTKEQLQEEAEREQELLASVLDGQ